MDPQLRLPLDDAPTLRYSQPRLMAFAGRAGSGKSLAAQTLIDDGWVRLKFADPLKNMLRAFFKSSGLDDDEEIERRIEGDLKETPDPYLNYVSPRRAMQTLGQEWGRECIEPCLWVCALERAVRHAFLKGRNVVVDDCRYENEVQIIRDLGGAVTMIVRPDAELVDVSHVSERLALNPDFCIENSGSQAELVAAVRELVSQ